MISRQNGLEKLEFLEENSFPIFKVTFLFRLSSLLVVLITLLLDFTHKESKIRQHGMGRIAIDNFKVEVLQICIIAIEKSLSKN